MGPTSISISKVVGLESPEVKNELTPSGLEGCGENAGDVTTAPS